MFSIDPTQPQKDYAYAHAQTLSFGRRGHFDGDLERQFAGILAQVVLADALGTERPRAGEGHDGGVDFIIGGKRCDLKAVLLARAPKPHWANNLMAEQYRTFTTTEVYVFGSVVKSLAGRVYIHGAMPREAIDLPRHLFAAGTLRPREDGTALKLPVDTIEIATDELIQVGSLKDLLREVEIWS